MLTPFDRWAAFHVVNGSALWLMVTAGVVGWLVSRWCWHWVDCLTWDVPPWRGPVCPQCGVIPKLTIAERLRAVLSRRRCAACNYRTPRRWLASAVVALLFASFAWVVAKAECQSLTYGGSIDWIHWRIAYHLLLISLLITATVIDFKLYIIPDSITVTGMILGVLGATWFGNLQLIPLWVDANQEVVGIHGPYIPEWIKLHWYWHGLAWSLVGLLVGGGLTWLVRSISSAILGQEAMGFGDITLMAMIGSFVGWQPILFVFALAPVCGMGIALFARLLTGKTYVPYGPYLSASTLVVLCTWRWLWMPLRLIFGHPPTIIALVGGAIATLALLLGCIRLFRSIPVNRA
jgi:leader peptidase (prepilin peptidase)/N-methyltransferase